MEKKKSPTNNNIEIIDNLNIKLIFTYKITVKTSNMTLSELRASIRKRYSMNENEYKLFIGKNSVNNLSNSTSIKDLLNIYKDNKIVIKTYKNLLDEKKQINDYEIFLNKNISIKNEEIKLLNTEYDNILKDLNSI